MGLLMLLPIFVVAGGFGIAAAISAVGQERSAPPEPWILVTLGVALVLVLLPIMILMLGGMTYGVVRWLSGSPAGLGEMLKHGARRLWPLILTGLLVGLAILGGYILLVVPGIIVGVATSVALPAVMAERLGAVDAFRRSWELTRGYRWPLFAAFLVLTLINFAISMVGSVLQLAIPILGVFLSLAVSILTYSLPWVLPAVAYHDLRVAKEGVDTSELARVFE